MVSKPKAVRMLKLVSVFALSVGIISGCLSQIGANNTSKQTQRVSINPFTDDAIQALPLTVSGINLNGSPSAYRQTMADSQTILQDTVSKFFKLECHSGEGANYVNYCPVDTTPSMDNKFTLGSLIGLISHADMTVNGFFDPTKDMDSNPEATVSASSFQTSDAGGQATRFLLNFYPLISRRGYFSEQRQNFAYGASADGKILTALTVRKHAPVVTPPNDTTDLMQVAISKDSSGSAEVLGFNVASIDVKESGLLAQRIILLLNLKTRTFLVKARWADQRWLVAAGKGGITPSGAREPGYFYIKAGESFDGSGLANASSYEGACINNVNLAIASDSNVVDELKLWDGTMNVANYLSLDASTAEALAPFIQYFSNGSPLTASDTPRSQGEYRDFPDSIL